MCLSQIDIFFTILTLHLAAHPPLGEAIAVAIQVTHPTTQFARTSSANTIPNMAKVPPNTLRPSLEVVQILDDVFTLCRVPFVYDFIFTADPVADISILTAPVQNEHAIAARITISGTEKTASFAHIFDYASDLYFCSIPAFSVGNITVGFATMEPASHSNRAGLNAVATERVQCNRYVRDDEKGVFLMFAENCETGMTEVDCMSHRSPRKRSRVCARFHTKTLRTQLRSSKGVLHPEELSNSLSYLSVATERRACPLCQADGNSKCGCVLPFRRPAHPLDFRNERWNMRLHTGLYEGGSTIQLFSSALPFVVTALSTRTIIKGSVDPCVIARLNKFAVQDRMSLLKVSPFGHVGCGENTECEDAEGEVGHDRELAESMLQEPMGFSGQSFSSLSLGDVLAVGSTPMAGTPVKAGPNLLDTMSTWVGSDQSLGTESSNKAIMDEEEEGVIDLEAITGTGTGTDTRQSGSTGTTSRQTGTANGVAEGMVDKAERRRQRNREAAAKSNVKRKIRNETLRRNLKEVNEKAEYLRGVEKKLREENVRLRGLATERMIRVSEHLTHIQIGNPDVESV